MACGSCYSERDLDLIPSITFSFVEKYIKSNKKSSGAKSINKGFKYYCEGYVQDLKVATISDGCQVSGRCYRSQRKNETPHQVKVSFNSTGEVSYAWCSCPIGLSGLCGHAVGVLYQLAYYKQLGYKALPEDIAKTSQPQAFHVPRGPKIHGKAVQDIDVRGYSRSIQGTEAPRSVMSTLYNPVRTEVFWNQHIDAIKGVDKNLLMLPALESMKDAQMVDCKFGKVARGSVLSYQQKLECGIVINNYDGVIYPDLPVANFMENSFQTVLNSAQTTDLENLKLNQKETVRFEKQTRLQSQNPLWFRIRKNRITASKIGEIYKRKKDPANLIKRLKSTRSVTTAAMRQGLASEPTAVNEYAKVKKNEVNLYPCGVVVNIWAPWLAASPDRKVYNDKMSPPFGLLEVKCPQVSSLLEVPYLKKDALGTLKLNRNHQYYFQVLAQMAVTGIEWCDLFVWCPNDHHLETIYFNMDTWQSIKDKVDMFFFNNFI